MHQINRIAPINHDLAAPGRLAMHTRVSSIGTPITLITRPISRGPRCVGPRPVAVNGAVAIIAAFPHDKLDML